MHDSSTSFRPYFCQVWERAGGAKASTWIVGIELCGAAATTVPTQTTPESSTIPHQFYRPLDLESQSLFLDAFRNDLQPLNVDAKSHFASQAQSTVYSRIPTAIAQRSSAIFPNERIALGPC